MTRSFLLSLSLLVAWAAVAAAENWPCWRGPRGDGTSAEQSVPTEWDGKSGKNILWKRPIPGKGHASPIVWEDRVFVTTCIEKDAARALLCLDRKTGDVLWQKTVIETPLEKKHGLNSFASGTPATDGALVYVTFLAPEFHDDNKVTPGEMIVAAYDFAGNEKWKVQPGRFSSVHGFCSSPVIFEDLLIVNGDHDGDSYIVALNKTTGEVVWKKPRANKTRSYVTPIIREIDGRTQMVMSGSKAVTSYDPRTGEIHWTMAGPTEQFVASLVYDGKFLFLTAGFPEYHILAIKPDGKGKIGDEHIVWHETKGCSYVPSPIVVDGHFMIAADTGICSDFDAATGERHWMQRLGGKHYSASLVTAGGLVYFLADDGLMKVVRPGKELDVVATNELGEYTYASPAISGGWMFIRGEANLYCIGSK